MDRRERFQKMADDAESRTPVGRFIDANNEAIRHRREAELRDPMKEVARGKAVGHALGSLQAIASQAELRANETRDLRSRAVLQAIAELAREAVTRSEALWAESQAV